MIRIQGSECRVETSGFRLVQLRVESSGSGCRVESRFKVQS